MQLSRRHLLSLGLAAAMLGALPAPVSARLSAQDIDDLKRISDYLNDISSLQGGFLQIGPRGESDQGTLYLRRPGRMRFDYDAPNPLTIIADGLTVAVANAQLETVDRYPLGVTPLSILLTETIDLANDSRIVGVERQPGQLLVTAREADGPAQGEITLIFRDPGLELRQWVQTDAQGRQTTVVLRDLRRDVPIDAALFVIQDTRPSSIRRD